MSDYISEKELEDLYAILVRINKISQRLSDKDKKIFDSICEDIAEIYLLIKDHNDEFEELLSQIEAELYINEEEDKPMVLSPFSRLKRERGIALSQALSSEINAYREGLQRAREARYESMIEESNPKTRRRLCSVKQN